MRFNNLQASSAINMLRTRFPVSITALLMGAATLLPGESLMAADPAFGSPLVNPFGIVFISPFYKPTLADLNGDGDLDLLVGSYSVYVEWNTGNSTSPAFAGISALGYVSSRSTPAVGDIDGDGDRDILAGSASGAFFLLRNTGSLSTPQFAATISNPFGITSVPARSSPCLADLDGDGDLDILSGSANGHFHFLRNTGSTTAPAFAAIVPDPFGLPNQGYNSEPALADLDGDGDLDIISGDNYFPHIFFRNTGTATVPSFGAGVRNPFGLTSYDPAAAPTTGDLDGDNDLDLVTVIGGFGFIYYPNTSPDVKAPVSSASIIPSTTTTSPVAINFTSSDTGPGRISGVASTELFVKWPGSGSFVSSTLTLPGTSGTFNFGFASGQGVYEFYTRAMDADGNVEAAPGVADDSVQLIDSPPTIVGGVVSLDPLTTDRDTLTFVVEFSEPAYPVLDFSNIVLGGFLSPGSTVQLDNPADGFHRTVSVHLPSPTANGNIQLSVVGVMKDNVGNPLVVPVNSASHTILNYPTGDVNKSGNFDLADVALLSDANLGLATLP